ncbi:MAG TPA: response regulator, partial [Anaerovoracaceae bacterium]|nr:response regulator [Anaerovoracaceae bacterium]
MRILIVEDELDSLHEIEDYLRCYDETMEIEACSNPLLAIKACQSLPFDAALLDIQMPEMTGLELADCLSAMSPEISLVFITAFNNYAAEAFELNAVDYILKPIRQERLSKTLDKIRKEVAEKEKTVRNSTAGVTIQAFGKMVVSSGDTVLKWKRHKSSEIFAYLLHQQGTPVHKEKICEMMWPEYDPQKALTYLQTIMYQLRKNIAEISGSRIQIEYADHCYRLCLNSVRYDVELFLEAFEQAFRQTPPSLEALTNVEQLYTGAYYEEDGWIWAMGRQQYFEQKYQKVLESIIRIE